MTESPIEQEFLSALESVVKTVVMPGATKAELQNSAMADVDREAIFVVPQMAISKYRADFVLAGNGGCYPVLVVVECDGKEWHSTREQQARDWDRSYFLRSQGFFVRRFSGKQIRRDPYRCAKRAVDMIDPKFKRSDGFYSLAGLIRQATEAFNR